MTDTWKSLGTISAPIIDKLAPVTFSVALNGPLAEAVQKHAKKSGHKPETIIAEAVNSYMGVGQ